MTLCVLALGSNLHMPQRQLRRAIHSIKMLAKTELIQTASFYRNPAFGRKSQPVFYNTVLAIQTYLSPKQLLSECQKIEQSQVRVRKVKWGARTLDIDILLYGQLRLQTSQLVIPHPQMLVRNWVLVPLLEIAPACRMPKGKLVIDFCI